MSPTREQASDGDKDAGADDGHYELADEPAHRGTKDRHEEKVADYRPNDTEDDVEQDAVARVHDFARDPSGDSANDDR